MSEKTKHAAEALRNYWKKTRAALVQPGDIQLAGMIGELLEALAETGGKRVVVVFTEGDLEEVHVRESLADAQGFAAGVRTGADYYGAGSCKAFVWPEDKDEARGELRASDYEEADARAEQALAG
jgi:hypothetical protein